MILYSLVVFQKLNKMDRSKRKPQFQIRKLAIRRSPPQKTPQLNALDVHSICLPSRSRKAINMHMIRSDNHYEEEVNPQVIYSPVYQQLYSQYLALREQHSQQRAILQKEIEEVDAQLHKQEEEKKRLQNKRDGLYVQVQQLREGLNEVRDKNYNLRWEIYHHRGAHYMNVNGLSLFQGGQMSYQQLLQMQQQIGNVPKGLSEHQISQIPTILYHPKKTSLRVTSHSNASNQQICCICYDQLQEKDQILQIKCRHLHHKDCLRDWLLKQRVCPICKQEIGTSQE